ncbi:MAG: hypothetical protein HRU24_03720 [Gammaproteobacteria bacterium]|nr:hypothetical protein [Gammaproteobacteria bacterium]
MNTKFLQGIGLGCGLLCMVGSTNANLLSSSYDANNFSYGSMFDITAQDKNLLITGLDLNLGNNSQTRTEEIYTRGSGAGDKFFQIQVWKKMGTWDIHGDHTAGDDSTNDVRNISYNGWKLVAESGVTSAGSNNSTFFDINDFTVASGETNGLWVTSTVGTQQINYLGTDEGFSVGDVFSQDEFLSVHTGAGLHYATNTSLFQARRFSGGIHYQVITEPKTIATLALGLMLISFRRKSYSNF